MEEFEKDKQKIQKDLELKSQLLDLLFRMYHIQVEKAEKYKETWKVCDTKFLIEKMKEQFTKLQLFKGIEDEKRRLLHIVNYCFFLLIRYNHTIECRWKYPTNEQLGIPSEEDLENAKRNINRKD